MTAWELAWADAKDETDPRAKAVADYAVGEWFALSHMLGRATQIVERVAEIGDRPVSGRAAQQLALAREGLRTRELPHNVVMSGAAAIGAVLAYAVYERHELHVPPPAVQSFGFARGGMSLAQVQTLAARAGLAWDMKVRDASQALPVPAIVHFRVDHFVAVVTRDGDRYLLLDPAQGGQRWVSRAALEDEMSGYVLVPKSAATTGWRTVSTAEAASVIGHCPPGSPNDGDPGPPKCGGGPPPPGGCGGGAPGMPEYSFLQMPASLRITDVPLTYTPSIGPDVTFRLTYNQRDVTQPMVFSYGNVGPKWTIDWASWIDDNADTADLQADVMLRGGGFDHYASAGAEYPPHWRTRASLVKVSSDPVRYERRLADGGVEVFAQSDGSLSTRRVFLTDVIDPQGLAVHLTYDASLRLVALTDATGLVTTLSVRAGVGRVEDHEGD